MGGVSFCFYPKNLSDCLPLCSTLMSCGIRALSELRNQLDTVTSADREAVAARDSVGTCLRLYSGNVLLDLSHICVCVHTNLSRLLNTSRRDTQWMNTIGKLDETDMLLDKDNKNMRTL
ncbi:hypothetical protein Tco_0978296 [Tanacetum coccineum]|uniref:Uncharacterized protein n=1 Tax=Tanacetum coccineum TaxID=301880 RepID=A0ABQ5EMU1_9ASTR